MCDFLYPYLLVESHCIHVESSLRMGDACAQRGVYCLDWEKVLPPEEKLGNIPNGLLVSYAIYMLN